MTYEKCFRTVVDSLEKIGVILDGNYLKEDYNLQEYIEDSVQFIDAIVQLEDDLNIEIPDSLLVYDNLLSLHGFVHAIHQLINTSDNEAGVGLIIN